MSDRARQGPIGKVGEARPDSSRCGVQVSRPTPLHFRSRASPSVPITGGVVDFKLLSPAPFATVWVLAFPNLTRLATETG